MAISETRAWGEHVTRWSWMTDRRIDASVFIAWYNQVVPQLAEEENILEQQTQEVDRVKVYVTEVAVGFQNIITRGYGIASKIITRGYGVVV